MPYALIQKKLGQKIDRKTLEEASVHAPNVARADCARIHGQLFGIVVTHLPHDQAVAFHTALDHFGFPTEIVPQEDLPGLPPPKFRRGIRFHPEGLTAIDGMGREDGYPWAEVQFAAGGFLVNEVSKTKNVMEWQYHGYGRGSIGKSVGVRKQEVTSTEKEFRLELYLSCEPYRLQFRAGKETLFRFNGAVLRANQEDQFLQILTRVGGILPDDCLSTGIHAALRHENFLYPSTAALEEEITWHLYQRLRR